MSDIAHVIAELLKQWYVVTTAWITAIAKLIEACAKWREASKKQEK